MIKKVLSLVLVFSMICTTLCMTVSYASVPVTEEKLKESFQKFVDSNSNEEHYQISVENNAISISSNDDTMAWITYDLTNDPTFSYTAEIKQGMSYDEFKDKTDNLSAPMLGYLAVANIQGVDFQDSMLYFTMQLLANTLSNGSSLEFYSIIDDRNLSEGVTIIKDPNDTETIYASEFGNHAMEYTKNVYGNSLHFSDVEGSLLDSFEWMQELRDVTDTSCKIVSTVTVNANADFSQLIGVSEGWAEAFANSLNNNDNEPSKPELTDIAGTRYEKSVKKLVELGVINGFEDNTFRPTENVTRAQFAKMLVEALGLKLNNSSISLYFPDLAETHWANNYIRIAVDNGIINGYPDGTFKPDNPVTYAESMAMILRAMKLEEKMNDKSWPLGYINEAKNVGLLDFVDYNDPNVSANRGETAISLFNMISIIEDKEDHILNATYSNENGTITLRKNGDDGVDFDFTDYNGSGTGITLNYSNGIASREDDFFDEHYKITATIDYNQLTVEASSDDPSSDFNKMNGTYYLQAN